MDSNYVNFFETGSVDIDDFDIRNGDVVVIKPNLVKESKENDTSEWESVITSPNLIQEVCTQVCRKLGGTGKVIICDAPQTDSSFAKIMERTGIFEIASKCQQDFGTPVEVVDLRNEEWTNKDGIIVAREELKGDPNGAVAVNLGRDSLFFQHPGEGKYYGADYDSEIVNQHHVGETQEYLICATPILADVFINMPKLKTHKKTGVTLSLKNLVGINADKNWLPHHTEGTPETFGDEFPSPTLKTRLERFSVKLVRSLALRVPVLGPLIARKLRKVGEKTLGSGKTVIRAGNWWGNNTTWRMVLDLNRCLIYANVEGTLTQKKKRYYTVVDGIVGMQGSGPMQGDPINCGVVITGSDPVAVDAVACSYMGFDWASVPVIREAFKLKNFGITSHQAEEIVVRHVDSGTSETLSSFSRREFKRFIPHMGWAGHIEKK